MLEIGLTIVAALIMKKMAEMERLNGIQWAILTLVLCLICKFVIPFPMINIIIGMVLSYGIMFYYIMRKKH
jgi:hypothetical protein